MRGGGQRRELRASTLWGSVKRLRVVECGELGIRVLGFERPRGGRLGRPEPRQRLLGRQSRR
jgi:hypothetical protein